MPTKITNYKSLLGKVRQTLIFSQQKIEAAPLAVARGRFRAFPNMFCNLIESLIEKVKTCRETGRKYDRYLADMFIQDEKFLNNLLLQEAHAVRM